MKSFFRTNIRGHIWLCDHFHFSSKVLKVYLTWLVIVAIAECLRGSNRHNNRVYWVGNVRGSPQPMCCIEESADGAWRSSWGPQMGARSGPPTAQVHPMHMQRDLAPPPRCASPPPSWISGRFSGLWVWHTCKMPAVGECIRDWEGPKGMGWSVGVQSREVHGRRLLSCRQPRARLSTPTIRVWTEDLSRHEHGQRHFAIRGRQSLACIQLVTSRSHGSQQLRHVRGNWPHGTKTCAVVCGCQTSVVPHFV